MDTELDYLQPYHPAAAAQRRESNNAFFPRLTLYRILVITLTSTLGLSKAWLSYHGYSTAPTTIDWFYGVLVFLFLYWLGIYEKHVEHGMPWLFEWDYLGPLKRLFGRTRMVQ